LNELLLNNGLALFDCGQALVERFEVLGDCAHICAFEELPRYPMASTRERCAAVISLVISAS
jgi:hypothetical protein